MTRSNDGREAFLSSSTAKRKTKSRQNLIRKENVEEGWKWGAREMSRSTTGGRTVIWTNRRARERSFFLFLSFLSGEANWLLCRMAVFVSARERADDARGSMSSTNLHFFSVFNNSSHLVIIVFFLASLCVCVCATHLVPTPARPSCCQWKKKGGGIRKKKPWFFLFTKFSRHFLEFSQNSEFFLLKKKDSRASINRQTVKVRRRCCSFHVWWWWWWKTFPDHIWKVNERCWLDKVNYWLLFYPFSSICLSFFLSFSPPPSRLKG